MAIAPKDYTGLQTSAANLIEKFGRTSLLIIPNASGGDAWAPTYGAPTTVSAKTVRTQYKTREIDGERILAGDVLMLVQGTIGTTPTPEHRFAFDTTVFVEGTTETYEIVSVETIRPAATTLLHKLQCRR